jgi:lipoic acid synthetase
MRLSRGGPIVTKSGLMVGLGETSSEVEEVFAGLRRSLVSVVTVGQYLRPSARHLPVERFVTPGEFESLRLKALDMGFDAAFCGPFVRSSYHAGEVFDQAGKSVRAAQIADPSGRPHAAFS